MDTREKILPLQDVSALLSSENWVIVVAQFDPLTAVQAKRLHALANESTKLLAIVLEDVGALLSASTRAALVAALRDVDAVTIAEPEHWRSAIPNAPRAVIVEDAAGERVRSAEFVQHIVARQAAAASGAGRIE